MLSNEIFRSYGKDYKSITYHLLEAADLKSEILNKSVLLDKDIIRIGIKPNVLGCNPAEFGATTHTEVIAGIIEYLHDYRFNDITIMEGSWVGDKTEFAFKILGYNDIADKYSVTLVDCQKEGFYEADCCGDILKVCNCYKNVDFLITVPVLKGHCQTKVTCALKNMKGLIPNVEKRRFHSLGLHNPIARLNTHIHQDFIVIDHICGDPDFEEGGNPLVRDCVMVSKDPVLTDAYAASLLGYDPHEIKYIKLAEELHVGCADLNTLRLVTVEGESNEDVPSMHRILEVNYSIEDSDSCSACYGMLIGALNRLKEEGIPYNLSDKICIGQGFRGKNGICGVGQCTRLFEFNIPGCPPSEDTIYQELKNRILNCNK